MKRKNLLHIFIILSAPFILRAQSDTLMPKPTGGATFGVRAGITSSNYYGPDIGTYFSGNTTSMLTGLHAGVVVNNELSDGFWLKHELLYTRTGAGVAINDSVNPVYTTRLKTHAMTLFPVSIDFHKKGFQAFAGPYAAMIFAASIKKRDAKGNYFIDKSIYGSPTNFEDTSKYVQKMDYGFTLGLEYEFKGGVSLSARYVRGYAEVLDYANKNTLHDNVRRYRIYNQYISLSLGYYFRRKTN